MDGPAIPQMRFNRVVSQLLEEMLKEGSPLRPLIDRGLSDTRVDVQLRTSPGRSWATLYCGLTAVLDIVETHGKVRFDAAAKHRSEALFDDAWRSPTLIDDVPVAGVAGYLDRILQPGKVDPRYFGKEGQVQTTISRKPAPSFGMFQREALPSFPSTPLRDGFVQQLMAGTLAALKSSTSQPPWWPGVRDNKKEPRSGLETDLIGIDSDGRLLVVEVKPNDTMQGLTWSPGQVRLYAEVFAGWASTDANAATVANSMADQRSRLALPVTSHRLPVNTPLRIAPVIAVGPAPMRPVIRERMQHVHDCLAGSPMIFGAIIDPVELWQFNEHGERTDVTTL